MKKVAVGAIAVGLAMAVVFPAVALACPSCFAGTENREAYFITFVIMTVLPLTVMGSIVYWLVRRARAAAETD